MAGGSVLGLCLADVEALGGTEVILLLENCSEASCNSLLLQDDIALLAGVDEDSASEVEFDEDSSTRKDDYKEVNDNTLCSGVTCILTRSKVSSPASV